MRHTRPIVTTALATFLALTSLALAQRSAEEVVSAIVEAQRGGASMRGTLTMTVTRPDRERSFTIEMVADGSERSLIRVVAPPRDAGQAFLRDGDDLFLYNPRLRRTLRLPPSGRSDAFLGSDLNYDDLAGDDLADDYDVEITADTDQELELTLTPHPDAPTPYGQVVLTADPETLAPRSYVFFDQREQAVRRMSFGDYVTAGDLRVPTRIEVEDLLQEGARTTLVIEDPEFDVEVPERCFTERALEEGC